MKRKRKHVNHPLYYQVQGGLKNTIDAHGAITKNFIPSATKRIVSQIGKIESIKCSDRRLKEEVLTFLEKEYKNLQAARKSKEETKDIFRKVNLGGICKEKIRFIKMMEQILNKFNCDAKGLPPITT